MHTFLYGGRQSDLRTSLQKGQVQRMLIPLLSLAGIKGEFTIVPLGLVKATSDTKGKLRLIKPWTNGVEASFHPESESSRNVKFRLSKPTGIDSMTYFSRLRDAELRLVESLSLQKPNKNEGTPEMVPHDSQQVNGKVVTLTVTIYDNQDALSLTISELRSMSTKNGVEFLTLTTARSIIMTTLSCDSESADKVLSDLCDGELLMKKGSGKAISYAVIPDKKSPESSGDNAVDTLMNLQNTMEQVKLARGGVECVKAQLVSKRELINRIRLQIPKLDEEIMTLDTELGRFTKFLEDPKTIRDIKLAEMLGQFKGSDNK